MKLHDGVNVLKMETDQNSLSLFLPCVTQKLGRLKTRKFVLPRHNLLTP